MVAINNTTTKFKFNIPHPIKDERYKNACLSKVEDLSSDQEEQLKKWISDPKNFLYCQSPYGVGKSYLVSAIAIFFYNKNIPVYMFNEHDLFKMLYAEEQENRLPSWKIEGICQNPIVIWDDFGSTLRHGKNDIRDNEKKELMYQFIDTRYNSMLPTIITTNFTISELGELINPRISSRIAAKENLILEIIGHDKRQEGM